jgi:hypothetical protein
MSDLYPYTDFDSVTDKILAMLPDPNEQDGDTISFWLKYYSCEPCACADKLAEETGLDRYKILELL